jgi:hypothetical protein
MPRAPPRIPPRPPQDTQPAQQPAQPPVAPAAELEQDAGHDAPVTAAQQLGISPEEWAALTQDEKKHRRNQASRNRKNAARVDDPESFPPLPKADTNPFIVVTKRAVRNQQNVTSFAGAARQAQATPQPPKGNQRRQTGPPNPTTTTNTTTEVTIMRDGGLKDQVAERAIRSLSPETIVMKARTVMEQTAERPPFLLGGRWASSANTTGNFVYIFNGNMKFAAIEPFGAALISPLKRGLMVPAQGWVWTQLRNVPVSDESGMVYDSDKLTAEVRHNAVMARATLCTPVSWQRNPTAIMGDASATALMSLVDEDGSLVRNIQTNGIHMFGRRVKFVVAGNRPALIQCGRCHMLGHNTRSPLCKTPPHAVRCYKCGGPHHAQQHAFYCKGKHADARHCNCKLKCILCGNVGHHARSRQCPNRGDFRPPTLATPEERHEETQAEGDVTEELTTTQREGPKLTAAGLPRSKTQKRKGKGRKPAPTNQFAALADDHDPSIPTTHPADPANHPPYFDPAALPKSGLTEWGDEVNDAMFTEIPDISATPESRGPSLEPPAPPVTSRELRVTDKLRVVDQEGITSMSEMQAVIGEEREQMIKAETDWGGTDWEIRECLGLRIRYAQHTNMPISGADVRNEILKGQGTLTASQTIETLRAADFSLGGSGNGESLTPYHWFRKHAPDNLFF